MLPDWMNVLSMNVMSMSMSSTCILFLGDHKIMNTLGMNMNGVGVESFSSAVC